VTLLISKSENKVGHLHFATLIPQSLAAKQSLSKSRTKYWRIGLWIVQNATLMSFKQLCHIWTYKINFRKYPKTKAGNILQIRVRPWMSILFIIFHSLYVRDFCKSYILPTSVVRLVCRASDSVRIEVLRIQMDLSPYN
jgi:hypothetical protein